jgi:hypothetical protein
MACTCFRRASQPATYHRVTKAFEGTADGTITLCRWCEGIIDQTPTTREEQLAAGTLRWQSFPRDVEDYQHWNRLIWSADAVIDAGFRNAYGSQQAVEAMTDEITDEELVALEAEP